MSQNGKNEPVSLYPFQNIINDFPCGVILLEQNKIIYANQKALSMLNVDNNTYLNSSFIDCIHPNYISQFNNWVENMHSVTDDKAGLPEYTCLKNKDAFIHVEMTGKPIEYDNKKLIQLFLSDIADSKKITRNNYYSSLVGNALVENYVNQSIERSKLASKHMAVMFLNLDHFNFINETYGAKVTTQLTEMVLERLKAAASESEMILALDNENYAIIIDDIQQVSVIDHIVQNYLNIFSSGFMINDHELKTTATIGISLYPENGMDSKTLLKNAELAFEHAKKNHHNKYQIFTSSMTILAKQQSDFLLDLKRAVEKNELVLLYQPIIDINSGEIVRLEALLRWFRANNEILTPRDFLAVAEETGLIFHIGDWVIETACKQNLAWKKSNIKPLPISINLTTRQFYSGTRLLRHIEKCLQETSLPPDCLELEISEKVSMVNIPTTMLQTLNEMGIHLSIDNFGAGFFSLSEMKRYHIKNVKINHTLIVDMLKNNNTADIVKAIILMCKALAINVIAEGVESKEQLEFLKKNNCSQAQGNYICKPLKEEELYTIFTKNSLKIAREN